MSKKMHNNIVKAVVDLEKGIMVMDASNYNLLYYHIIK